MMRSKPMLALVSVFVLIVAACGSSSEGSTEPDGNVTTTEATSTSDTPTTTEPTTTAPVPDGGSSIVGLHVDEIVFGAEGHVRIVNTGDSEISLDGLWLCQFPTYLPLSGALGAGESLVISAAEIGGLSSAGGEAALYTERDFDSADAIFDYVSWGTGGQRGGVAATAGIWPDRVTVSAPDDFIELGGAPGDPEAWG